MRKVVSGVLATVLSVSFIGAEMLPANAASVYVPQANIQSVDIVPVVDRGGGRPMVDEMYIPRHYRGDRRSFHRGDRRDFRWDNRRSYKRDGARYWRGHRGYDHYRPGYRRNGDLWFPLAAFAAGAIISGAIANDRPPAYSGNSHVQYCYNRYRSYRASDNTFQPYNGPRQQCISPY